jgi:hypothetical protein
MVHAGTTPPKATNTGNATATSRVVLQDTEREPFRVHTLHAALVMEGKQVDVETDWTYVDIDPGTGLCTNYPCPADEDGRYGYDPRQLPDGQTSAASDGSAGSVSTDGDSASDGPATDAGTDRVRTAEVAYTTADAPGGRAMSTAAFDASEPSVGTLVGRDPATGRDVVEVPNASYTGSDATVESITAREAANLTLTVNAALTAAGANVTGVHLDRASLDGDGTVGFLDVVTLLFEL